MGTAYSVADMAAKSTADITTIGIRKEPTKTLFDDAKPDELTSDEFVRVLINRWEWTQQ